MGEYANIKRKRFESGFLKWLEKRRGISIELGGKHNIKIKYSFWERPFPVPFNHNIISKYIIKGLMKKLVSSGVCTKEEFDNNI